MGDYTVDNKNQIYGFIKDLMKHRDPLYITYDSVKFISMVVDVSHDTVYLDTSSDPRSNKNIQKADEIEVETAVSGVKISWVSNEIELIHHKGYDTFKVPIPDEIERVQRREFFRVPTPVLNPYTCLIRFDEHVQILAKLTDLSLGGFGCEMITGVASEMTQGEEFDKCELNLHDADKIPVKLQVCRIRTIKNHKNVDVTYAGFQFIGLRGYAESQVNHAIQELERLLISPLSK